MPMNQFGTSSFTGVGVDRAGLDAADARVARMAKRRQPADAFPQRELERRHTGDLPADAQEIDVLALGIPAGSSLSETVMQSHAPPHCGKRAGGTERR